MKDDGECCSRKHPYLERHKKVVVQHVIREADGESYPYTTIVLFSHSIGFSFSRARISRVHLGGDAQMKSPKFVSGRRGGLGGRGKFGGGPALA